MSTHSTGRRGGRGLGELRVSRLRLVALVLAFAAATAMVFGTAGFSAVSAERGVTVAVADDPEEAYLGIDACHRNAEQGNEQSANNSATPMDVTVTNQFATTVKVTGIDADGSSLDAEKRDLGPGDSTEYEFTEKGQVDTVTVHVEGTAVSASASADVSPQC